MPGQKIIIGESATRLDEGEPLTHPEFLPALATIRRILPDTPLSITTNGTLMTPSLAEELVQMMPLEITVSLNSISLRGRLLLLGDKEPTRAARAVSTLAASGIPFHGSLVAMPHLVGEDDIAETVRFLSQYGALTVRIFLPGHTKYAPDRLCLPPATWPRIIALARDLTRELDAPVIPEPSFIEDFTPLVYGVMPGTPARRAGVQANDVIATVNGKKARTRVDAFTMAKLAANPLLVLQREGRELEVIIKKERGTPPGFVVNFDFDPARLAQIGRTLKQERATRPLLLCSQFGEIIMKKVALELGLDGEAVLPVQNNYFGGSIKAAGLLVVEDLLATAGPILRQDDRHDLVLVPREAFDHTGRDLTGKSIHILEQELQLPVFAL